jgi:leucyl aminopeptidase
MPLPAELRKLLDSEIADIANVKIGNRAGGMLIAGQFLNEFVSHESGSWAHLDIAGPANNAGSPYSVNPAGATGVMVRTITGAITPVAS